MLYTGIIIELNIYIHINLLLMHDARIPSCTYMST